MADNQSQRPYRASEPPVRSQAKNPSNDPLAELARLSGQTDPFGEYGRSAGRVAPAQPAEYPDWNSQPVASPYPEQRSADSRQSSQRAVGSGYDDYGRPQFAGAPVISARDLYPTHEDAHEQVHQDARGYPAGQEDFQQDPYEQDAAQYADEGYYEDAPPPQRRLGLMAIVGVLALAVIGTAGVFGYRALFGSSASSQPPPVIKADAGPSKIVPAATSKDAQSNKLINDRMNERGQSEKLVSREEQPIDRPPATVVLSQAVPQSGLGSGVVGSEPKKIRTIAIRPDQPVLADAVPQPASPLAVAAATRPQGLAAKPAQARSAATDSSNSDDADSNTPAVRAPARQVGPANAP